MSSNAGLKLNKFKKVAEHPDHVVMKSHEGHEIKISKSALSPKMRGEIAALPLHKDEGGQVQKSDNSKKSSSDYSDQGGAFKGAKLDPDKQKAAAQSMSKAFGFADGGKVESKTAEAMQEEAETPKAPAKSFMEQAEAAGAPGGTAKVTFPDDPDKQALAQKADEGARQMAMGAVESAAPAAAGKVLGPAKAIAEKGPEAIEQALKALEAADISPSHPAYQLLDKLLQKSKGMKFADGGEVPININMDEQGNPKVTETNVPPAAQQDLPQAPPADQIDYSKAMMANKPYGVDDDTWAQTVASQNPQARQPAASPTAPQAAAPQAPGAAPDPFGVNAYQQEYLRGVGDTRGGLQESAKAQAAAADAQAKALEASALAQQKIQNDYQSHYQSLESERQSLQHDILNGHIDPNHYLGSQDTGQRIGNAISLVLGGLGAGLTGGQNPAMQFIQSQIDRDINAQVTNLGKKESLLSANLHQFGNLNDATRMTQVMMMDSVANQMKLAAAKAGSAQARAELLQRAGQLEMQAAPVMSQIAMKRTITGNSQGLSQIDPESLVRILPEGEQEPMRKELKEAQGMVKARDNILDAFDKAVKINTVGNRIVSPVQSASQLHALVDPLVAGLSKETAGRFTDTDAAYLKSLFTNATDSPTTAALKRRQIDKLISSKMNFPHLKSYGIDPMQQAGYNSQGQATLQTFAPNVK